MPEIPTDIRRAWVAEKRLCYRVSCLAQETVIPNKLGPVGEGQGRQAPGQDMTTPTLAAYRDQSSALPFKFCCLWTPVLRAWQLFLRRFTVCQSTSQPQVLLRRNGTGS